MDVRRYYAGFNLTPSASFVLNVGPDNDGLNYAVTIDSGTYYHDLDDGTGYGSFAVALQTAINAAAVAAGSTVTYTVEWQNLYPRYKVLPSAGTITVTANTTAQQVLGIAASPGAVAILTSSFVPWFVIVPQVEGVSNSTGDFQSGDGIVDAAITDGGQQFGVSAIVQATRHDWTQPFELLATCYKYAAGAAAPFTFQHLFEHVAAQVPMVLVNTDADWAAGAPGTAYATHAIIRFKNTATGALFAPNRVVPSLDTYWDIPFLATVLERLR